MANSLILKSLIEKLGISINAFERAINVGNSAISKAITRESEIKDDTVEKILRTFPQVNRDWLETGEGEIFTKTPSPNIPRPKREAFVIGAIDGQSETNKSGNEFIDLGAGKYVMLVPKVHQYAYGGYLKGYADEEYMESLPRYSMIVDELHKGKYVAFEMRGDSMDNGESDAIQAGDVVTGRSISKYYWTSKLHMHKFREFVIVHLGGIMVKEIISHDVQNGIITIHSKNPDKIEYPDEEISLADVAELFNVIEVSKKRR